jgi:hypothetical protein
MCVSNGGQQRSSQGQRRNCKPTPDHVREHARAQRGAGKAIRQRVFAATTHMQMGKMGL